MDRVRRLSLDMLAKHRSEFGEDFAYNKQALDDLSIIRSKGLKNEIAGYITKVVKNEMREIKAQEAQERARSGEDKENAQRPDAAANAEPPSNTDGSATIAASAESGSSDAGIVIHDTDEDEDAAAPVNGDTAIDDTATTAI